MKGARKPKFILALKSAWVDTGGPHWAALPGSVQPMALCPLTGTWFRGLEVRP